MSGRRLALVIAVDRYDHPALNDLAAPAADAEALAEVLGNPELGGFEVDVLHNATSWRAGELVDGLLADRRPSDLVLLHFSCHGLKDATGELYLAATNTVPTRLSSTAVDGAWVNRLMRRSLARRVVLLLDCCYGGAFERGVIARGGNAVDVGDQFRQTDLEDGRGRVVITASTAMEYAFEGAQLTEAQAAPSVFTGAFVEGIRTGDADRDQDGQVSLSELYDYVYERVRQRSPAQTPSKWEFGVRGGLYIARNPHRRVAPFNLGGSQPTDARLAAVEELARLATGSDLNGAAAARAALGHLRNDESSRVAASADEAWDRTRLRLAVPEIAFGHVPLGGTPLVSEVAVGGGALALTSSVTTSAKALSATIDDGLLRVVWTPTEPGNLDARVTLSGAAGEAELRVTGRAIKASPPKGSKPTRPSPARPEFNRPEPSLPEPARPLLSRSAFYTAVVAIVATLVITVVWFVQTRPPDSSDPERQGATSNGPTVSSEILSGHTGFVREVAFAPAGGLLASASDDGTVRLWDLATRATVAVLTNSGSISNRPYTGEVKAMAFSPNGKTIVTGDHAGRTRMWNVDNRSVVGEPLYDDTIYRITVVAVSADGDTLATSSNDPAKVQLWKMSSRSRVGQLAAGTGYVNAAVFGPDGKILATGGTDKAIRLWDVASRQVIASPLAGHTSDIRGLAFSPDGTLLASCGDDNTVRVWDVAGRRMVGEPLVGHTGSVRSVAFSPNGRFLATGSDDGTVRLWDITARRAVGNPLRGHTGDVFDVAFSPDSTTVASGGADRSVRLWAVADLTR